MNYHDELARSLIRAASFRLMRHAPIWVAVLVLMYFFLAGLR